MRLAVSQKEAAELLGISVNTFKKHVRPSLTPAYIGGATRYRVEDLRRVLEST